MALSGSYTKSVGAHWRVRLTWSATQNISNNTSTITANLYWEATTAYGAVRSSAPKLARINIDGVNSETNSATAALSGNQSRRVHRYVRTISHDSDGTKSFRISARFGAHVTLSGVYYGDQVITTRTPTLNRIPRGSSISVNSNWTAGNNKTIRINRHSTNFRHEIDVQVQSTTPLWNTIKTISYTSNQTSKSTSFTTSENERIFNLQSGRATMPSRLRIRTYNGSTLIATSTQNGTVTAPTASGLSSGTLRAAFIDFGNPYWITRKNSNFTHTVEFNCGSFTKRYTDVETQGRFDPTTADQNSMYSVASNTNSYKGNVRITTYYGNAQVRSPRTFDYDFNVRNSDPTISGSAAYRDTNSTTTAITGDNQFIIQGKSNLRVEIPSSTTASAKNGASLSRYEVVVNGVSKTANYSSGAVTVDFGNITASSNTNAQIRIVDSRGNYSSISLPIKVMPYQNPTATVRPRRANGFEEMTTIAVSGRISPLNNGSGNKNSIKTIRYRTKKRSSSSWGSYKTLQFNGIPNFISDSEVVNLEVESEWDVQVNISDELSSITVSGRVDVGVPIMFIDSEKKSVGFGDFPNDSNQVFMNSRLVFGSNMYSSKSIGEDTVGGGAMYLANSDVTGINGLYFSHDPSDTVREGINWLRTDGTPDDYNISNYDNFKIRDNMVYLNDIPIATDRIEPLWEGDVFLSDIGHIDLPKTLRQCANGIILVWGQDGTNFGWQYSIIHNKLHDYRAGGVMRDIFAKPSGNESIKKSFFITVDSIYGVSANATGENRDLKLKYIYEW